MARNNKKSGKKRRDKKKARKPETAVSDVVAAEPAKRRSKKRWKIQKIAIDMQVHKLIEAARSAFGETQNDILRRLLGLDHGAPPIVPSAGPQRRAKGGGAGEGGWSKVNRHGHTVFLPDGTELRAAYAGQTANGEILDGMWVIGGRGYNSPSAALIANVTSRTGGKVNLNGWRHWEVRRPGAETWTPLKDV